MSDADKARGGDMGARVKPLVWEESLKDRWIGTPDSKLGDLAFWIFRHHDGTLKRATKEGWQFYPSLTAAKAAAQADYEACILAALEPAPDMAELVEAAKPFALLDETDDSIGDFCEKHPVEGGYVADLRAALTKLGVR